MLKRIGSASAWRERACIAMYIHLYAYIRQDDFKAGDGLRSALKAHNLRCWPNKRKCTGNIYGDRSEERAAPMKGRGMRMLLTRLGSFGNRPFCTLLARYAWGTPSYTRLVSIVGRQFYFGSQSSMRFPSASTAHPNRPYDSSSTLSSTFTPSLRSCVSSWSRFVTRKLTMNCEPLRAKVICARRENGQDSRSHVCPTGPARSTRSCTSAARSRPSPRPEVRCPDACGTNPRVFRGSSP